MAWSPEDPVYHFSQRPHNPHNVRRKFEETKEDKAVIIIIIDKIIIYKKILSCP